MTGGRFRQQAGRPAFVLVFILASLGAAKDAGPIDIGTPERVVARAGQVVTKGGDVTDRSGRHHHITIYRMPDPDGLTVTCEEGLVIGLQLDPRVGMTEKDLLYYNRNERGSSYRIIDESEEQKVYRGPGSGRFDVVVSNDTGKVTRVVHHY